MKLFLAMLLAAAAPIAFAIGCDCEVQVLTPTTASHQLKTNRLKVYELEEYSTYAVAHQRECRDNCHERFRKDLPEARIQALLLTYAQALINERAIGYNCTGLTTLKYPVRVKARLGRLGLGTVVDQTYVVNHEELCFKLVND
jgi:hypothetical protein